ncbi:reductive dehalogenase [Dehalococcoides mccartyi]|nr:reductive dehalogenase [Dehalococcoides mccartyi]
MSKFHSAVTRRDFMKGIGLAGAGIGTAAAVTPLYHDLDEIIGSKTSQWKRPWWVKELELEEPTTEIDWSRVERFDARYSAHSPAEVCRFVGLDEYNRVRALANTSQDILDNKPGSTLRDNALNVGAGTGQYMGGYKSDYVFPAAGTCCGSYPVYWTGQKGTATPESLGVPKWSGTPEENTQMVRAAMRFFGATDVSVGEMNEKTKKFVSTYPQGGDVKYLNSWPPPDTYIKKIVFEDVDKGYTTDTKYVIPNKPLYCITYTVPMSKDLFRTGPGSQLRSAANISRYRLRAAIDTCTKGFLTALGYQGLEEPYPCFPSQAGAVLDGLAEMGRNSNVCISPEYGSVHGYFDIITDLPMAPTHPIDAGIFRFCHTCHKCADECPAKCIDQGSEPTWDFPASMYKPEMPVDYHAPGKRLFWSDPIACQMYSNSVAGGCGVCMGTCTFNTNGASMVHDVVKATLAKTSLLNGFLWNADKAFGYGMVEGEEKEKFWEIGLPAYGFDTTVGSTVGGY